MPKIKFNHGSKATMPKLDFREPGITDDTEEVFVGGVNGNVQLAKQIDVDGLSTTVSKKATVYQQATEPSAQEGELWLDTSDNAFQGTVFDSLNTQLTQITSHISTFPRLAGETDDTGRLQRAFNSGKNILLDFNGSYTVDNVFITTSNFTIYGNNATLTAKNKTTNCLIIGENSSQTFVQVNNVRVTNLNFQGITDGSNNQSTGINIISSGAGYSRGTSCNNIEIDHCNFFGGFTMSIIANGTTGLKIHDCYGTGNYYILSVSAGGYFILTQTCFDVHIYNNKAVATAHDRHAIYISCDPNRTQSYNENVMIHDNYFDWSLVNAGTQLEDVISIRTTKKCHIHDNTTIGGWGGILVNPSHGDMYDVVINNNIVRDVLSSSSYDLEGIGAVSQDKGGNFHVYNLKISDNIVSTLGQRTHGISLVDTIGFTINNNLVSVQQGSSFGIQLNNVQWGHIEGNHINGNSTARSGIAYYSTSTPGAIIKIDRVTIGSNLIDGFSNLKEEVGAGTTITNLKHQYARTFEVDCNGSGSITVVDDNDNLVSSVISASYGCDITFNPNWTVKQGYVSVTLVGGDVAIIQNRSANTSTNVLSLNFKNASGVSMPIASNAIYFIVTILS